jgi:hypothetical protein
MIALLGPLRRSIEHHPVARKTLLGCGVAAFALYVCMDAIAVLRYDGYSYVDQTISELSAIGAPTRSFWIPLGFIYSALMVVFGLHVWELAAGRRALQVVGLAAAGAGILGFVGWPFAPMHQREVLAAGGETWVDTVHLVLAGMSSLLFMLSIGIGANTFGTRFRLYSIATLLVVFVAGGPTGYTAPDVSANEPTPWLGVTERVAIYSSMLWYVVLALGLLRAEVDSVRERRGEPPTRRRNMLPAA